MKYYLIVGEASGDLHASRLMREIKLTDHEADFRFIGGDLMAAVGGTLVRHYREMAYMGFIPVLLHLPKILGNMRFCKQDISQWQPDVCIMVDYPGFNLKIAKFLHKNTSIPVIYYISPKIWAWKEYRIKNIKRDVNVMLSILPFEKEFFEYKHNYPIHYVGNPTADEVREFNASYNEAFSQFATKNGLDPDKPIIALLAGSRQQEIKDNLPAMIEATKQLADYQIVIAGAPAINDEYYQSVLQSCTYAGSTHILRIVKNATYPLLYHSRVAIVTSGTATLETALFRVPQVVCYKTPLPRLIGYLRKKVLKVKYVSLVNLIANKEVVPELVAETFSAANIRHRLCDILPDNNARQEQLRGYEMVASRLGDTSAPVNAARIIVDMLADKVQTQERI